MSREWRCLQRLKRSGQALGISKYIPGRSTSVAVTCPACPQPALNMPDDWLNHQTEVNAYVDFSRSAVRDLTVLKPRQCSVSGNRRQHVVVSAGLKRLGQPASEVKYWGKSRRRLTGEVLRAL